MGIILAKFRKEKTTIEILEDLETKIKNIEDFSISTQARQKRFVGNFLVFSVGLYVIASIVFYCAFFPSTWRKRTIYSIPLLLFPILIILLKRLVAWFFQRKLNRNTSQLKLLRAEKKKIIEKVMDKETYKVALEILNRFGDASTRTQNQLVPNLNTTITRSPTTPNTATPQRPQVAKIAATPQTQIHHQPQQITSRINQSMYTSPYRSPSASMPRPQQQHQTTPFPIINQSQKSLFEKVVDYLINDGPSSRYGMICKECFGHNGMVSHEEYEYSAFKCAFCKALNPAKKLRPIAPRLQLPNKSSEDNGNKQIVQIQSPQRIESNTSASISDRESGSETEPASVNEVTNFEVKQSIESNTNEISNELQTETQDEKLANEDVEDSTTVKTDLDKKNE